MGKYKDLATDIVKNVGGRDNIISLTHCVTRLRFELKDANIANDHVFKNMDGVITVMKAGGQYQIVIGNHVPDVYKEVCEVGQIGEKHTLGESKQKESIGSTIIKFISGLFLPSMSILTASGILKGVNTILLLAGVLSMDSGLYQLLAAVSDAMFLFFPIIIGYTAFKNLGGSPFLGLTLGAALCYPAIQNVDLNVFGFTVNAGYQSTVIPIILLSLVAVPLEKALNKIIPSVIKTFVVPAIVMVVCLPLGFCVIGPAANWLAAALANVFDVVYNISPVLSSALLGGLWQVLVLFGVHGVLALTMVTNIIAGVPQPLMAALSWVSFVQTGAVLAIWVKTKDKNLKNIALPAWISGIFGVTEPAIYGVTLPRMKQFVFTCIGGAFIGAISGLLNLSAFSVAGMGIFSLPGMINPSGEGASIVVLLLIALFAVVVGFVPSILTYKDEDSVDNSKNGEKDKITVKNEVISSPMSGKVLPLSKIKDKAFSDGLLGNGVFILPEDGKVYSPCDGIVMTLFASKHAIGIVSNSGAEVLIHIGLDTVKLDGKYFDTKVAQDDVVKKGQLLAQFDIAAIKNEGYSLETPVIITNTNDYLDIVKVSGDEVKHGEDLITVIL